IPQFFWDDVGSWGALDRHLEKDPHGNILRGNVVMVEGNDNIVIGDSNSIISMVGVKDLIVVKNGDRFLICSKKQDQEIKKLLSIIAQNRDNLKYL
ncbi:MAG: mannose-1-phosphate guanylyltransferase, partial [Spirochaetota bacterium]